MLFTVTEGEDKPLKYPKMFEKADWVVLTKTDLLPYLQFDAERAVANCLQVNPNVRFLFASATSGDGMDEWFEFLRRAVGPPVLV